MICPHSEICGGCLYRTLSEEEYRRLKEQTVRKILQSLPVERLNFGTPIFVGDGARRRATFAFRRHKGKVTLGFNRHHSDELVDIVSCPLLVSSINNILPDLHGLIADLCQVPLTPNSKKSKAKTPPSYLTQGDIAICAADNGLDLVLEFDTKLELDHRLIVSNWAQSHDSILRISHRRQANETADVLLEKAKPQINIGGVDVYISAGTFLQATSLGEKSLINLVLKYLGDTRGKIADLFCGIGTFSYPLCGLKGNHILAADSSADSLKGFQNSINRHMLNNITITERNLFKYPLSGAELKGFAALVFDPPRAGAAAQMSEIAKLSPDQRPQKIIAVSCNPHSFVKDAAILLNSAYQLQEVTLVDQFSYSNHSELVALFTLKA